MPAFISSPTPEGSPNSCPLCGSLIVIEPSQASGDAPCPACGTLLWFVQTSAGRSFHDAHAVAPMRDRLIEILMRLIGIDKKELVGSLLAHSDPGLDSLEPGALATELEDEIGIRIPYKAAQEMRTIGDIVDFYLRHRLF